jgi:glutamate racemase
LSDSLQVATPTGLAGPVGVFDSGVGGLSVLRHIRAALPHEDLLYFADSAYAPYGDRTEAEIIARSIAVADFLLQQGCKAIVVACNTATAAAIKTLRERYLATPFIGVEPGLKPAAALTRSGTVGVLATRLTLGSSKFQHLQEQMTAMTQVRFLSQPCIGLVEQIEKGELHSPATAALLRRYVEPLLEQGADTLVLGCTHYPFVRPLLEQLLARITSRPLAIVDTGAPVARRLHHLLQEPGLLGGGSGTLTACTTGGTASLEHAFARLLGLAPPICRIVVAADQAH